MRRVLFTAATAATLAAAAVATATPATATPAAADPPPYCVSTRYGVVCAIGSRCVVEGGGTVWNLCLLPWP